MIDKQSISTETPTRLKMQGKAVAIPKGAIVENDSVCLAPEDASAIAAQKTYMQSLILPAYELGRAEASAVLMQAQQREQALVRYIAIASGVLLGAAATITIERLAE
jgi:ribosomal protein L25 (general stress protein Ctc)